jgi:hypothetical protein
MEDEEAEVLELVLGTGVAVVGIESELGGTEGAVSESVAMGVGVQPIWGATPRQATWRSCSSAMRLPLAISLKDQDLSLASLLTADQLP